MEDEEDKAKEKDAEDEEDDDTDDDDEDESEEKDSKECYLIIKYSEYRSSKWFFFDSWYVRPYDEYGEKGYWMNWTDEEFAQLYELVN